MKVVVSKYVAYWPWNVVLHLQMASNYIH